MVNPIYPTRSFIRFQSKTQLTADIGGQQVMTFVCQDQGDNPMERARPNLVSPSEISSPLDVHNKTHSTDPAVSSQLDEILLKDITRLVFHPDQHPEIYRPCRSREQAVAIEQAIAVEIVEPYKQIKFNETKPSIKALNALL